MSNCSTAEGLHKVNSVQNRQNSAMSKLVKVEGGSHTFSLEKKNVFNREVLHFLKNDTPGIN
jgi:pimeloyl-ACP methyl ester carboxylesterase